MAFHNSFLKSISFVAIAGLIFSSCRNDSQIDQPPDPAPQAPDINNTYGYSILNKVKGIWNGPVTSTTALGSFPEWIVDFRPISAYQISAKNELDSLNNIHMSFFIGLYNNQYSVMFRNGGGFAGQQRVSYFRCDSVSESVNSSYYRFVEAKRGAVRAWTEVIRTTDSLYLRSYTNIYNSQPSAVLHMSWSAKLQDTSSCQNAVTQHSFPQKSGSVNLSNAFNSVSEAIFYNTSSDPYGENAQPYLGQSTLSYTYSASLIPQSTKHVLMIVTTQPLFSGFTFLSQNLKFRSRYVLVNALDQSFAFNYMHPGTYYLYALYDSDNNLQPSSGDWISTSNTAFTLNAQSTATATTQINFTIP